MNALRAVPRPIAACAVVITLLVVSGCGDAAPTAQPGVSPEPSTSDSAPATAPALAGVDECPASDPAVPARDDGLPDLTLPCLTEGPDVRLAGLRGTPMVVNVWASWCAPCRDEIPHLVDLDRRTGDELMVLGIDLLDRNDPAIAVVEDFGMTYSSVVDADGDIRAALGVQAPPVTFFVDADGVIVSRKVGQIRTAAELDALVEDALGIAP